MGVSRPLFSVYSPNFTPLTSWSFRTKLSMGMLSMSVFRSSVEVAGWSDTDRGNSTSALISIDVLALLAWLVLAPSASQSHMSLTMSPDMCACVASGAKLISLVGPLLFFGFTTTRLCPDQWCAGCVIMHSDDLHCVFSAGLQTIDNSRLCVSSRSRAQLSLALLRTGVQDPMLTEYSVSAASPVRVKWFLDGGSLSSLALPPLTIW
ncbi:hypothetical protein EYF80_001114 [Liparis tanakae]|uniref:Uncharacterized protein n=1 Tax=Liparis tanakae TaxID=230148 RepID=A0A4Z2JHN8_9TELE|nr:hypothetical protein EYF80_001114 [Liparis tanakae]